MLSQMPACLEACTTPTVVVGFGHWHSSYLFPECPIVRPKCGAIVVPKSRFRDALCEVIILTKPIHPIRKGLYLKLLPNLAYGLPCLIAS